LLLRGSTWDRVTPGAGLDRQLFPMPSDSLAVRMQRYAPPAAAAVE
jgi:hypothetical protein